MKKTLPIILSVFLAVIVLAVWPVNADSFTEGYYTYEISNGEATITNVNPNVGPEVVIPSALGGYPVTVIGEKAFEACSITSVVIPDSVTVIGEGAFCYCSRLTDVTIPDSVNVIGKMAFYNCSSLTNVTIPDSVTSIGNSAFFGCETLSEVIIPDSVTDISGYAFGRCYNLTDVTFGSGVKNVSHEVFEYCSIQMMTFDGCSPTFEWMAFANCKIEKVNITDLAAWCKVSAGGYQSNPLHYSGNLYVNGELVTDLVIPEGVTSIGAGAFQCAKVCSVMIPDGVTIIDYNAFSNCTSLTKVTMLDSVTEIRTDAFSGCSSLNYVRISDGITRLTANTFSGCTSLVFNAYDNALYLGNEKNPYFVLINAASNSITACEIHPDTVLIAGSAFDSCESLTDILIPDSVITIGELGFRGCTNLTNITISDSVTTIDFWAFSDCTNLKTVYYTGTEDQWNNLVIEDGNDPLLNAELIFIESAEKVLAGDIDGDEAVTQDDAVYLLLHTMFGEAFYPIAMDADIDKDGAVTQEDAVYLLLHTMFGESFYPLN